MASNESVKKQELTPPTTRNRSVFSQPMLFIAGSQPRHKSRGRCLYN